MFLIIFLMIALLGWESYEHKVKIRRLWSYADDSKWPGASCKHGSLQSPIDIQQSEVIVDWNETFIRGPLEFKGYKSVLMTGINNGLSVLLSTDGDPSMHPELTGGPLRDAYRLEQMHFHWLSEHAINGRKYPMEIHFVHVRQGLSVVDALRTKDGLAIVAIMCSVKSFLTETDVDHLKEVMVILPKLNKMGNWHSGVVIDLTRILPGDQDFFAYAGSLTSPKCNEVVIWMIYDKPISISAHQYQQFVEISSEKNFRDVQPVMDHKVYSRKPYKSKSPLFVAFARVWDRMRGFLSNVKKYTKGVLHRYIYRE